MAGSAVVGILMTLNLWAALDPVVGSVVDVGECTAPNGAEISGSAAHGLIAIVLVVATAAVSASARGRAFQIATILFGIAVAAQLVILLSLTPFLLSALTGPGSDVRGRSVLPLIPVAILGMAVIQVIVLRRRPVRRALLIALSTSAGFVAVLWVYGAASTGWC